ncbi:RHS repeat-associated core domain-containing protein [Mariniflexile ostreae]|uniref:RHS repeat-associated core domain-containing protein n=1 Tax=Mariniflexile ostreae TaxID=1520892 RepID=A0ABV5FDI4_9FLAO
MFNGKELDRETNLSYYGARYLDMKTSLWLSVDPLAEKMPSFGGYVYAFNNPVRFIDPDGMEPDDWYLNLDNGNYEWHDGSADKAGYWNLGTSTDVAVGKGYSLQNNGAFSDNNTGRSYGKGDELAVGKTGSFIQSNGTFFEETQTWVNHNKSDLLTFADDLKTAGNVIAVGGYGAAVVGSAVAGVGAAPGAAIAGIGNGVGLTGSLLEFGVNLMTEDYGNAGENAAFMIGGQAIDMTFDRILPGPTPNISNDAYHILKQNFTTIKPIIIENAYEQKKQK